MLSVSRVTFLGTRGNTLLDLSSVLGCSRSLTVLARAAENARLCISPCNDPSYGLS